MSILLPGDEGFEGFDTLDTKAKRLDPHKGWPKGYDQNPFNTKLDWSQTIDRYWRHKKTRDVVEVQRFLRVDGMHYRVVFRNPEVAHHELSLFLSDFKKEFEPMGNTSSQY